MDKEILSVKEVASYLQLHPVTIYEHLKKRRIPALKIGGRWRFIKKQLDLLIFSDGNRYSAYPYILKQ